MLSQSRLMRATFRRETLSRLEARTNKETE